MRVIAFTKYDCSAASTRQRVLQYRTVLAGAKIELFYRPLLDDTYVRRLVTGEPPSRTAILRSYMSRLLQVLRQPDCDLIWVYAELFPYLPRSFESLVHSARVPVVYDWDDAFFHAYNESRNPFVRVLLRNKLERAISRAAAVTCGNQYLRDHAARFCTKSIILPTVVDTSDYRPLRRAAGDPLRLGWIGSPSTWKNVRPILPVLRELCEQGRARVRAVGAGFEGERDRFPGLDLIEWSQETEIFEVQNFDVGIMPLIDEPFERGKSGFKLVQYMACGVPAVGSPVGVNATILGGSAGILASSIGEWRDSLVRLLEDSELRRRMGESGRKRSVEYYSLEVHAPRLVDLFRTVKATWGGRAP